MDPISTIVSIGRLTNALYDQVQYIHSNKSQCVRLMERIHIVNSMLEGLMPQLKDKSVPESYSKALFDLHATLLEADELFKKLTDKSMLKQFQITVFAQTTHYGIAGIHRKLDQGLAQLNLGLQVQNALEKEKRKKIQKEEEEKRKEDQKKDMVELLIRSYEVIKIKEVTEDKLLLSKAQRDEVEEKQIASLQYNVDKYIQAQSEKKQRIKSQLNEELSVPFSDLIIENLIVETPFGKLYYGRLHEQPVAIRMLEGNLMQHDMEGFIREVRAMKDLRSDYILPIFAICQEPGRLCLITKYMEQGSLKQVLHKVHKRELDLSIEQRHKLILEIAMGLYYLHQKGICHRNLRSEHVLIDADGHARIAEFRLSQNKMLSSLYEERESVLEWMAPEIWMNSQSFTPEADIYSFGMVLWEMMTCKIPYAGWDRTTWIDRIQKGERENLPSTVPEFYCNIIKSCWQARPENRSSLLSIITDLKDYKIKSEAAHILTGSSSSFWKSEKLMERATTPSIESPLLPLISAEDAQHFAQAAKICFDKKETAAAGICYRQTLLLVNPVNIVVPPISAEDADHFVRAGKVCFDKNEFESAEICYRRAALLGSIKAMNDLAILHLTRREDPNSKAFAHQLLKLAATSGYIPAMHNLANQLEQGDGIKANSFEASEWREKAKMNEPLSPNISRRAAKR